MRKITVIFILTYLISCKKDTPTQVQVTPNSKYELGSLKDWTKKADLPALGRHHAVGFSINGNAYVGLGTNTNPNENLNTFFKYSPNTDTWTELLNSKMGGRGYVVSVTHNNKEYIGFGFNINAYKKDLWEYNPQNDSWKELKPCPCEPRGHPAMVQVNGKIYVGLGNGSEGNFNDWWEYDISKDIWSKKADFPSSKRHHPYYFAIGDKAYVGFGHGTDLINGKIIYKDFYEYTPQNDSWKKLKDFPSQGRVAGSQFSYGGFGYIISGQGEDHDYLKKGEFWKYDPKNDSWTELQPHPEFSRWAPATFMIGNRLFFFGGQSHNAYCKDLFEIKL
jgi:N-acetylneuraminic acid mutarotase